MIWIYNGIIVFSVLFYFLVRIIPHFIFGFYSVLSWYLHKAIIIHRWHSWVLITNSGVYPCACNQDPGPFSCFYSHFTFIKIKFHLSFFIAILRTSKQFCSVALVWLERRREKQLNNGIMWTGILHFIRCCI